MIIIGKISRCYYIKWSSLAQAIQDAVVLLYPVLEPFKTAKPLPNQTSSGSRKRPGRNGGRNRKATGGAKCSGTGMEDYDFDSDDSQCSEDL